MSRIGKKPIAIPKGVKVDVQPGAVEIQGPKGKLRQTLPPGVGLELQGEELHAKTLQPDPQLGKFQGLARSLVANAVRGVTEGFKKELDIVGVGYRAETKPFGLTLALGYSHPIDYKAPPGIELRAVSPTVVEVTGSNKEVVGQVAAEIRSLRPPEPYKGKGVKYQGEVIRRKAGKAGGK